MYDISDEESLANLTYWIKDFKENINNKVLIYIIGNKSEMQEKRAIT